MNNDEIKEVIKDELKRAYQNFNTKPKEINDYIRDHNETAYCEALLFPDGRILDVRPSHTEAITRETCKMFNVSREEINNQMPIHAGVIHWLVEYSNIMAIWYNNAIADDITEEQIRSLELLQENRIIDNIFFIYIAKEKSLIELRDKEDIVDLMKLGKKELVLVHGILINNVED